MQWWDVTKKKKKQLASFIDNKLNNFASSIVLFLERMRLVAPKMAHVLRIRWHGNTPRTGYTLDLDSSVSVIAQHNIS